MKMGFKVQLSLPGLQVKNKKIGCMSCYHLSVFGYNLLFCGVHFQESDCSVFDNSCICVNWHPHGLWHSLSAFS